MDIEEGPAREWVKDTLNIELDLHTNHDLRPALAVAVIGGDRYQINAAWASLSEYKNPALGGVLRLGQGLL